MASPTSRFSPRTSWPGGCAAGRWWTSMTDRPVERRGRVKSAGSWAMFGPGDRDAGRYREHSVLKSLVGTMVLAVAAVMAATPARAADPVPPPANYLDTMQWYANAAKAGDPQAQYLYGEILARGLRGNADRNAAAEWFEKAARQGHALAAYALGTAYESGRGRGRDPAKAAEWYTAAAKAGILPAFHNLARLYETGTGVKRDQGEAVKYYTAAAEAGLAASQHNLGLLYLEGRGVPKDPLRAWAWLKRAMDGGYTAAARPLGTLEKSMSEPDKAKAYQILKDIRVKKP
ncbi:MAG: hypothetical protein GEU76_05485 [Alphaproteobacteria bacterium]|nr:hypothetical protein [Alphaproteobacteria bacterium]